MAWTEDQIDQLKELWGEGLSTSEIGRKLGVTKNAVVGKAHRLGLPPRPSPIKRAVGAKRPARSKVMAVKSASRGPTCMWPIGHPNEPGFRFCGKSALTGKPYCQEHYDIAYIPAGRRDRDRSSASGAPSSTSNNRR